MKNIQSLAIIFIVIAASTIIMGCNSTIVDTSNNNSAPATNDTTQPVTTDVSDTDFITENESTIGDVI